MIPLITQMEDRNANLPESECIRLRVGINLGDVMVDEGDMFGDGVYVAARIEALAAPGEVCVQKRLARPGLTRVGSDHQANLKDRLRCRGYGRKGGRSSQSMAEDRAGGPPVGRQILRRRRLGGSGTGGGHLGTAPHSA